MYIVSYNSILIKMKYICEYQIPVDNDEGRYFALSAVDKASYIHSVLVRLGNSVEIISPSFAKKTVKSRIDVIDDRICLISGFSLGWHNTFTKFLSRFSAMLWLFLYLLKNCKKDEKIMVYHGVQNVPVLLLAKKIIGFDIILEVEEIYSSLMVSKKNWREYLELKMIKAANSFIFASEVLERTYNVDSKPFAISYGAYKAPPVYSAKANDGRIHIVYAGLIEKEKAAFKSGRIAKYLNSDYYIHIIGYGDKNNISLLKKEIEEITSYTTCSLSYDGLKRGEDYLTFLQSCHIGLCPLSNDNIFQRACFPSKISSYLANNLEVVTTENPVLRNSKYCSFLHFASDDSPASFAEVIKKIKHKRKQMPNDLIRKMDNAFCEDMKGIM